MQSPAEHSRGDTPCTEEDSEPHTQLDRALTVRLEECRASEDKETVREGFLEEAWPVIVTRERLAIRKCPASYAKGGTELGCLG